MKTIDVIDIMFWYQDENTKERLTTLPLKTQWILRKNIKLLEPIYNNFIEFRDELIKKRNEKWFVQDNGKCDIVEEEGESILRIKEEYMEEFTKYEDELNSQIAEIIEEDNDIEKLMPIDVDTLIETVDENENKLEIKDLEALEKIGVN